LYLNTVKRLFREIKAVNPEILPVRRWDYDYPTAGGEGDPPGRLYNPIRDS
jgi:hypothetical protein